MSNPWQPWGRQRCQQQGPSHASVLGTAVALGPGANWRGQAAGVAGCWALPAERGNATSDGQEPKGEEPCCRAGWLKSDVQLWLA